jgi:hypothetical protein
MPPCVDCTWLHPREATHILRRDRDIYGRVWRIQRIRDPRHTRLYCHWHATVRATQRNAALRHRQTPAKENA